MQREKRFTAMLLIPGMLMGTLRARDPIAPWLRSLSRTITGRAAGGADEGSGTTGRFMINPTMHGGWR